jgi:GNAT superfamily N-acetyltransferase
VLALGGNSVKVAIARVELPTILLMRDLYRKEMNCPIAHDRWHERGQTDCYLVTVEGAVAGYGALARGQNRDTRSEGERRDVVVEFYVLPIHRPRASSLFRELLVVTEAAWVQAQTNDTLLSLLLYDFAHEISSNTLLFQDGLTTAHHLPNVVFRKACAEDAGRIFVHRQEGVGDWVLETQDTIVATGGYLAEYNRPYGDIFMEVAEPFRRQGYGSYLVQELKRVTYEQGSIPAARCNIRNTASCSTLQRAGFAPCARILSGRVAL